jgi:hypothetical protein
MKTTLKFFLIILVVATCSCEKRADNEAVNIYIDKLMSGDFVAFDLPAFTHDDIPALLDYRDASTIITTFPRNPVSSYFQSECRLGIYILWTVESIREVENNTYGLIGRFPSQNSIIALRETHEFKPVTDEQSHREISRAYYEWWYSSLPVSDKMKTDPLKGTKYIWH